MGSDIGIQFSLKLQARVLAAQPGRSGSSRWLTGTNSLREDNEIRVLQYDPDQERLVSVGVYNHAPEVWSIAPSAKQEDRFITVWARAGTYGVSLWKAQSDGSLLQEGELAGHNSIVRSALWHHQQPRLAMTVEEAGIHAWDISEEGVKATGFAASGELLQLWDGALHPTNLSIAVTTGGHNLQMWDLRTMTMTSQTSGAHRMPSRDVSWAPHDEHRLVSGGDDCKLKFWDTRMFGRSDALLELGGHSHWVWRAQYNPV